jgi:type VI secretion system secreted protein Hcp
MWTQQFISIGDNKMAQSDILLVLDGIDGETKDSQHPKAIEIESYSWGETQTGSMGAGTGGGAGKVLMQDFHFTKRLDKASAKLFMACATGEHVKSAKLIVRKAGGDQKTYYTVTFTDLLISSFQTSGHGGAETTESISFNFAKVEMDYKPQDEKGELGGSIKAGYDVKLNKKV